MRILIYVLILFNTCIALLSFSVEKYSTGFIYLFNVVLFLSFPKIITLALSKKQKYTFGLEKIYSIYNDRIEMNVEQSKIVIPFCRIKIASEDKNNFYMIYENQIICISKSGFAIGSSSIFADFIKSKVNFK